jgi:hypothetical protein
MSTLYKNKEVNMFFQLFNFIFAYLMELEGISTVDLYTLMKTSPFTAVEFRLCNIPKLIYSLIYYNY